MNHEFQVESGIHVKQNVVPASEYHTPYDEALHHLHFAEAKCDTFCGQTEILSQIKKVLVVSLWKV